MTRVECSAAVSSREYTEPESSHAFSADALGVQRRGTLGSRLLHHGTRLQRRPSLQLLLVAAVFGIVNSLLRPLLTVLTCPLIVLTLGIFTLVINALMLLVTGWLSTRWDLGFTVSGFWPAFWGGLVVGS